MADLNSSQWLDLLQEAAEKLSSLPGTERSLKELQKLHERLSANQHLIAVFGAFSAGKSSLINALIREPLLVVSPNPTTAAVTHVESARLETASKGMSKEAESGSLREFAAMVSAKTYEEVWEDVRQAFGSLHLSVSSLEEGMEKARGLKPADFAASGRKVVAFLRQAAAGYLEMQPRLGTSWQVDMADLAKLTANEQFASYVNEVHIYAGAEVLAPGLSLVDTPGVDSIHRRHTNVAFDYMRRADAIVFVLYYTHAFSRADKDFLLQLAGVQDVFGADKLMVVINAVDLAKSVEEREAVHNRVVSELRQLGIRNPRVFEVSSQIAFAAEQVLNGNADPRLSALLRQRLHLQAEEELPDLNEILAESGVPVFRGALTRQVQNQADELSVQAARQLLREVSVRIHTQWQMYMERQRRDAAAVETLREARQAWQAGLPQRMESVEKGKEPIQQSLLTEWTELVFHAGERIRMRFGSLIREAFHPGRFRTGSNRQALSDAGTELIAMLDRQVELECRTFALRAAKQVREGLGRFFDELSQELVSLDAAPEFSEELLSDPPELVPGLLQAELDARTLNSAYRHFSSPKQFFEQNGQQAMQGELESTLLPQVRAELESLALRVQQSAISHVQAAETQLLQTAEETVARASSELNRRLSEKEADEWTNVVDWFHHLAI